MIRVATPGEKYELQSMSHISMAQATWCARGSSLEHQLSTDLTHLPCASGGFYGESDMGKAGGLQAQDVQFLLGNTRHCMRPQQRGHSHPHEIPAELNQWELLGLPDAISCERADSGAHCNEIAQPAHSCRIDERHMQVSRGCAAAAILDVVCSGATIIVVSA